MKTEAVSDDDGQHPGSCALCGALYVLVLFLAVAGTSGLWEFAPQGGAVEIAALGVAFLALFVAVYEARQNRIHGRKSVQPHLVFETCFWGVDDFVGLRVRNNGLGPARIIASELRTNGTSCGPLEPDGWFAAFVNLGDAGLWPKATCIGQDESVGTGQPLSLLYIPPDHRNDERVRRLETILRQLSVSLTYTSLYDENPRTATWDGEDLELRVFKSLGGSA